MSQYLFSMNIGKSPPLTRLGLTGTSWKRNPQSGPLTRGLVAPHPHPTPPQTCYFQSDVESSQADQHPWASHNTVGCG